jgi:hypothetical protein
MRLKPFMLLSGLALMISAASMQADLAFILTPAVQAGVGTNEVFFTGTLTNTSLTDNLFLNNIQFSFSGAATNYLTADTNFFFANVPGILLPGETYADAVFGIVINPATPSGSYSGTVTMQGGPDIFTAISLTNQIFQVSMPPAAPGITVSGGNLLLSWPSPPGNFVLQQNSDLTTTNWMTVTNLSTITDFQNQVILPPAAGSQFYRLKYP